ncbi:hypothetical protein RP75_10455 [Agrobacterium arsenijevicii]|uniref:Uncharacterized protein n=1 Tax=Agrobacterium arsenijevicii TaxID=1585697 RepID=A0ABR5D8B4_9HYPH|nr:hypothetical protein RP75_10455 [Agrobacterium arsenijevicii]
MLVSSSGVNVAHGNRASLVLRREFHHHHIAHIPVHGLVSHDPKTDGDFIRDHAQIKASACHFRIYSIDQNNMES